VQEFQAWLESAKPEMDFPPLWSEERAQSQYIAILAADWLISG